jgi:hypothetical protein
MRNARMGRTQQCMRNARMTVLSIKLCQQDIKNNKYWFIFYIDEARHIVTLSTLSWFPVCSSWDETVSAYAQRGMKSFPSTLSMRWNHFRVCSVCDEIVSAYAQRAMKSFPCLLSMRSDVHVKTVKISSHTEHTQKFVRRMLSMRW